MYYDILTRDSYGGLHDHVQAAVYLPLVQMLQHAFALHLLGHVQQVEMRRELTCCGMCSTSSFIRASTPALSCSKAIMYGLCAVLRMSSTQNTCLLSTETSCALAWACELIVYLIFVTGVSLHAMMTGGCCIASFCRHIQKPVMKCQGFCDMYNASM